MNREERRKMMRDNPKYRDWVKAASDLSFRHIKKMFQKVWEKDDESLNEGKLDIVDNGEDQKFNY